MKSFVNHLWIIKVSKFTLYYLFLIILLLLTFDFHYSEFLTSRIFKKQEKIYRDTTDIKTKVDLNVDSDCRILPRLYHTNAKTLIFYTIRTGLFAVTLLIGTACFKCLIPTTNSPESNIYLNILANNFHWFSIALLLAFYCILVSSTIFAIWLYDKNVIINKKMTNVLFIYILMNTLTTANLINNDIVSSIIK